MPGESKRIVPQSGKGDGLAMANWPLGNLPDVLRCPQMTGHGSKFGRKKEMAVAALLTHRNTEEAAKATGVGYKTLLRWQQIPEFQQALRRAKHEALSQTTARLLQAAPTAATVLLKVMVDPTTPSSCASL